jgi:hypothetical protein
MSGFSVSQIVGTPDSSCWTQVHHFSGLEKKKLALRGEMTLLLSLKGPPEEEATTLGRELINRVYEEYYGNLNGAPMERLKASLEKIGQEKPVYLSSKVDVSLIILVLWNGCVYLAVWGRGKVLVSRDGEIGNLVENNLSSVKIISGRANKDDLFCLGTESFFSQLPSGTIMASLATGKPDSVVEILSPLVHARKDQASIGAAVVAINHFAETEKIDNNQPIPEKNEREACQNGQRRQKSLKSILSKNKRIISGIFKKLPRLKIKRKSDVFVVPRNSGEARRKMTLTFAGGFLLLLLVSIFFGWQKKQQNDRQKQFADLYSQAEKKLASAESIKSLNPQESLSLLDQFFSLTEEARPLSVDGSKVDFLEERGQRLKNLLGGGEKLVPDLFFNLNLIADGAKGTSLFVDEENVYVLDAVAKRIFSIGWPQKKTSNLAMGSFLADMEKVFVSGKTSYLLSKNGVFELESEDKATQLIESDWQEPINFSFWGGNVYLLDIGENRLWKYPKTSLGFGQRVNWFFDQPSFDWQQIVDFDIDGRVWLLNNEGKIYKYFGGRSEDYSQVSSTISGANYLSVASDSETLAFWGEKDKSIYVLTKSGQLAAKIPVEIDSVYDLSITPDGKKIFLLTSGEVYWIDMEGYTSGESSFSER